MARRKRREGRPPELADLSPETRQRIDAKSRDPLFETLISAVGYEAVRLAGSVLHPEDPYFVMAEHARLHLWWRFQEFGKALDDTLNAYCASVALETAARVGPSFLIAACGDGHAELGPVDSRLRTYNDFREWHDLLGRAILERKQSPSRESPSDLRMRYLLTWAAKAVPQGWLPEDRHMADIERTIRTAMRRAYSSHARATVDDATIRELAWWLLANPQLGRTLVMVGRDGFLTLRPIETKRVLVPRPKKRPEQSASVVAGSAEAASSILDRNALGRHGNRVPDNAPVLETVKLRDSVEFVRALVKIRSSTAGRSGARRAVLDNLEPLLTKELTLVELSARSGLGVSTLSEALSRVTAELRNALGGDQLE